MQRQLVKSMTLHIKKKVFKELRSKPKPKMTSNSFLKKLSIEVEVFGSKRKLILFHSQVLTSKTHSYINGVKFRAM